MAKKAPARPSAASRSKASGARRSTPAARPAAGKKTASTRLPTAKPAGRAATAAARPAGVKKKTATKKTETKKTETKKTATHPTSRAKTAPAKRTDASGARTKAPGKRSPAVAPRRRAGGAGDERTLAQTPETGRTVQGPTNPMPTKRSTGTAAGAGDLTNAPALRRARRQLREVEEQVPSPPSSLALDRSASAARTGAEELQEAQREHTETGPVLTGGDIDASWEDASTVGDEAPGGDNPTPDQDRVDDIGKALGVEYADNEELKGADKIIERDRHRWELDPASSEDYNERD